MFTKRDHVRILAKNVVTRLEQDQAIELNPRTRQNVYQDLYYKLAPMVMTDEEVREKVLEQMGKKAEALDEAQFTESDAYKTAKSMLMARVGENALQGLYYQRPVKMVAEAIAEFLMSHHLVDEVYADDETLHKSILDHLKRFNPENLH